ncbi:MAG: monovalent cation/H(+) antiporter subunit G [Burkholderiaceae bacterium]
MNSLLPLLDVALTALVVTGAAFALIGSWGLARLSRFLLRLHGPTKVSTLGVGCVLLASMASFTLAGEFHPHELLITLFVFITTPVAAHLLVKAAIAVDADNASVDEVLDPLRLESPPHNANDADRGNV